MRNKTKYRLLFVLIVNALVVFAPQPDEVNDFIKHIPVIYNTAGVTKTISTYVYIAPPEPTLAHKSLGIFRITAYCSCKVCCGKHALNRPIDEAGNEIVIGASGEVLIPEYSVTVDPTVIPYGTKLYINGKEYIAHDCGEPIKGKAIDIYYEDHNTAKQYSIQYLEVLIDYEEEL